MPAKLFTFITLISSFKCNFRNDSYGVLKSLKEELEYRNVHLMSVIESERQTKWKLEEFAEEQRNQLESLRKEVCSNKYTINKVQMGPYNT